MKKKIVYSCSSEPDEDGVLVGEREGSQLQGAIETVVGNEVDFSMCSAVYDELEEALSDPFVRILHISAHGTSISEGSDSKCLIFDDPIKIGASHIDALLHKSNQVRRGVLDLLFLSACESESKAEELRDKYRLVLTQFIICCVG